MSSNFPSSGVEVVVRGAGAIVLRVAPVHVVVVDEAAIEQHAAVRLEGPRDHVGGVGVRAAVFGRAEPAFGVGLEHEAAEVGNRAVDLVDRPSRTRDARVERIERVDAADPPRAAEVERDGQPHAPRPERLRDARHLRQELGGDDPRVGVHVVDRAAVDADRRHQPGVVAHAAEVVQDVAVLPEDRPAGVAALDRAVEVVPVVDPADRRRRLVALVECETSSPRAMRRSSAKAP